MPCYTYDYQADDVRFIQTPQYYGGPYPLMVSVDGAPYEKLGPYLDYDSPTIGVIIPPVLSSGSMVLVSGTNFYIDTNIFTFIFGNKTLPALEKSLAHTVATVEIPPGTGTVECSVRVFNKQSASYTFTYEPPTIVSLAVSPQSNLYIMTVSGVSFGNDINLIKLNGFFDPPIALAMVSPHISFSFSFQPARHSPMFSVTVDGLTSAPYLVAYPPPTLQSIERVPTEGGLSTVHGNNFGVDLAQFSMKINYARIPALWLANNSVALIDMPPGTGSLYVACQVQNGDPARILFSYNKPFIRSYYLDDTTLTIYGDSFGNDSSKIAIVLYVVLTIVPMPRFDQSLSATVAGIQSNILQIDNDSPTIINIKPLVTTQGGETTITGTGFGNDMDHFVFMFGDAPIIPQTLSANNMAILNIPSGSGSISCHQNPPFLALLIKSRRYPTIINNPQSLGWQVTDSLCQYRSTATFYQFAPAETSGGHPMFGLYDRIGFSHRQYNGLNLEMSFFYKSPLGQENGK
eukprot:gene7926-9312_t